MDPSYSTTNNIDGDKPKPHDVNSMYTQQMQDPNQPRGIIQHTFQHDHNYAYDMTADQLQKKQKERNRIIAEKLSPLSKYKMQEYMRRSRVRGVQRRKFSLLMGLPHADKKRASVVARQVIVPQHHQQMDPSLPPMASLHQQNMISYDQQPMHQSNYVMNGDMRRFDGDIELD